MKKKIHVISIHEGYLSIVAEQLDLIFGDLAIPTTIIVQDLETDRIAADDIVLVSRLILLGVVRPFIPKGCPTIVAHREVNMANTQALIELPPGQNILIVNDTLENAQETMTSLKSIFFNHTYYLDDQETADIAEKIDYIVTPGEIEFVPKKYKNVIDIGPRLLSFKTVQEIAEALQVNFSLEQLVNRFVKSQMSLANSTIRHHPIVSHVPSQPTLTLEMLHAMNEKIEEHGFLQESLLMLAIYKEGKEQFKTFGRKRMKLLLQERGMHLTEQQIRLRLEILQSLDLVQARPGRSGTTITELGEAYLHLMSEELEN